MQIVILTGAGVSAESGLGTFRDQGGIWSRYRLEDVATPEGFARNPALVHTFYNARRASLRAAEPNAAHHALAELEQRHAGRCLVVTQNVDDLHTRAGSRNVLHMHGELQKACCASCGNRWRAADQMHADDACPACGALACRPDVVWFGEDVRSMDRILGSVAQADLFVLIGTSATVYPAAGLMQLARDQGAQTLELNLEASAAASVADRLLLGPATEVVPRWVAEWCRTNGLE